MLSQCKYFSWIEQFKYYLISFLKGKKGINNLQLHSAFMFSINFYKFSNFQERL